MKAMQVDRLLIVINKLAAVLELYRGKSVEKMLDDIYQLASVRPAGATPEKGAGNRKESKGADKLPPEEVVILLPDMPEEQRSEFLTKNKYIVEELKVIASLQGIKIPSKARKNEIIDIIARHSDRTGLLLDSRQSEPARQKPVAELKGNLPPINDSQGGSRLSQAAAAVQDMNQEAIMELLSTFNKSEILEIARRNNFKISSNNNRDNIIIMLAKNLGFKDLTRRISQRPQQ
jgi:hypothetical protein